MIIKQSLKNRHMDYKEYHNDWKDIIRPKILARDNYICRKCKVRHKSRAYRLTKGTYMMVDGFTEEWAKATGRKVLTIYLQVAHIDQNKSNNEPENLMSLCPICHGRFDKSSKSLKRLIYQGKIENSDTITAVKVSDSNSPALGIVKQLVKQFTGVSLTNNQINIILNSL